MSWRNKTMYWISSESKVQFYDKI